MKRIKDAIYLEGIRFRLLAEISLVQNERIREYKNTVGTCISVFMIWLKGISCFTVQIHDLMMIEAKMCLHFNL